jgi:acyl-CoA synthetase (AMP-forming)/AMP-acid ligase II
MLRQDEMEHLAAFPAPTVPDLIRLRAATDPSKVFVRLLDLSGEERVMTFAEMGQGVASAAEHVTASGAHAGDIVPVVLDTSEELLTYFFGIMASGAVPVALPVPLTPAMTAATSSALSRIGPSLVVTNFEGLAGATSGIRVIQPTRRFATASTPLPAVHPQDAAMMQFSSGTTTSPKGILLSHYNLLANCAVFGRATRATTADIAVSWLPLFHDMGLIGAVIGSMYHAATLVLMSPVTFLMRPHLWLEAISKYRGTITVAPNSAFEMCTRRVRQADAAALDLSSLRVIFCGAELIREQTIQRFVERFGPRGLDPNAFFPVYGLAENTLAVTVPDLGAGVLVDRVEMDSFAPGRRTMPSDQGTHFVGVGRPGLWHEVKVTDAEGNELEEGTIGYVRIKSPCVMKGYYRDPAATNAVIEDGWLKTNDLGYFRNGNLFICGRDSDLIIKAGRNLSPMEIEDACRHGVPELLRLAAFGIYDEQRGTEALILMAETRAAPGHEHDRLRLRVRSAVAQQCSIEVDHVWLVPPRTVPHTTSGKIQRRLCRDMWKERAAE